MKKKLHLTHFKTAPKSHTQHTTRCFESIQRYFSHWNIIYWNEDDFLHIVSQKDWHVPHATYLLEIGAWAVISDIIRLYALYHEGGVYADWDVEFLQDIPQHLLDHGAVFGFEPYTYNGVGTIQVGMQCCIAQAKHPIFRKIFHDLAHTLWTPKFSIIPEICTKVLEHEYHLPSPRSNNTYFYLDDYVCVIPHDIFYPFMGIRGDTTKSHISEKMLYNRVSPHTVALHWEFSQIKDNNQEKKGWTNYLHTLRSGVEKDEL